MNYRTEATYLVYRSAHTINTIPGDKSLSHRAIILGALAEGTSSFSGFLTAEDCLNTLSIFQQLGATIVRNGTDVTVTGGMLHQGTYADQAAVFSPKATLDVGNSGTGIRLITGVLAALPFDTVITGDASIQRRPMRRVIDPLSQMGAQITGQTVSGKTDVYPPLQIRGTALKGISYTLPVASAQVKSCVLLASLFASGETVVIEPEATRDHTERMLAGYGAAIRREGNAIYCSGRKPLVAPQTTIQIPADISSAAFLIVLGLITPHQGLRLTHVGMNPTRDAIVHVLRQMGARIEVSDLAGEDFEPHATLTVHPSELTNIDVDPAVIPFLIDEIPILAVAAMFARGTLRITGAKELRVKESDRIAGIARIASDVKGVTMTETEDGFTLSGKAFGEGFEVDSHGDHRIAMSAIILAHGAAMSATIRDCACIQTSFPNFFKILAELGFEGWHEE